MSENDIRNADRQTGKIHVRPWLTVVAIFALLLGIACPGAAAADNLPRRTETAISESKALSDGIVCDGGLIDPGAVAAAVTAAITKNQPLLITAAGGSCVMLATLEVPSGLVIHGVNYPTLALRSKSVTTLLRLNGTHGAEIRNLTLDGGVYDLVFTQRVEPIVNLINASSSVLENITVVNSPRDIEVQSGSRQNMLTNITVISPGYYRSSAGERITYHGLTLADANDNVVKNFSSVGHAGWTVGIIGTSQGNQIINPSSTDSGIELIGLQYQAARNRIVSPFLGPNAYPRWSSGRHVERGDRVISNVTIAVGGVPKIFPFIYIADSSGVTGPTAPNCKSPLRSPHPSAPLIKCDDGGVRWTYWRDDSSASDNCISITGSNNTITGGYLEKCRGHGISLYGDHNTVTGVTIKNVGAAFPLNGVSYYGINMDSAFSGVSQSNAVVGNIIEDRQPLSTIQQPIHVGAVGYRDWIAGMKPTNPFGAGVYATYKGQLYKSFSTGKATAPPPPTCVGGSCADGGGVQWQWVRSVPGSTNALNNAIHDNSARGTFSNSKGAMRQGRRWGDLQSWRAHRRARLGDRHR